MLWDYKMGNYKLRYPLVLITHYFPQEKVNAIG